MLSLATVSRRALVAAAALAAPAAEAWRKRRKKPLSPSPPLAFVATVTGAFAEGGSGARQVRWQARGGLDYPNPPTGSGIDVRVDLLVATQAEAAASPTGCAPR